ncbi:VCBS repeat-containing protein [bacterium AH-315-M10]|nr:VCBS repeat-containing protein [bacterium AH-315-M10]
MLADVNGDGRADIVGFSNGGVSVSISTSSRSWPSVTRRQTVIRNFGYRAGGWRIDKHPRMMADVNGDGKADIIGFGYSGGYVALSSSSGNRASYGSARLWVRNFGYSAGSWRVNKHPRLLADVNGDGKADIVGFGSAGAYVSLSTGSGFLWPTLASDHFGYSSRVGGGYRIDQTPRMLADINGDGCADIVGFGHYGARGALFQPNRFIGYWDMINN